jgi:2-polyprenyl-3-methyl-5-hydroxy-6-metoxy-1,4-benzoquinol methylase
MWQAESADNAVDRIGAVDQQPTPDLEELLGQLRQRVAERREAGLYPEGLEDELDAHFQRIAARGHSDLDTDDLRDELQELKERSHLDPNRIALSSRVPGGAALHRAAGKVVTRQTQGIMQQVGAFGQQLTKVIDDLLLLLEDHRVQHQEVAARLDAVMDRLARFERASLGPHGDVDDLRRRVEVLERAEARRGFQPWFNSEHFEDRFRGKRDELLARYRDLAEHLRGCAPVLDIGCGRCEFLELLRDVGVDARGIEIDPELVKAAKQQGFDVALGDAIGTLSTLEDNSLGGIVLIQVVEHLAAQELLELITLAVDKLRQGGRLVMETVNPQSLYVFAHSFYLDPTHSRPIHPAYLEFLCREVGFSSLIVDWRSPPPEGDRLSGLDEPDPMQENIDRLNRLLFGPGDYAIIATR